MPPQIKISAYKAWKDKPGCKPYDTDFYTEMYNIKNGHYKSIVDQYRLITDSQEKASYKINNLPSLTISAVCKDWRKLDNVVNHTGLLNLDIDKKSNQHVLDWGALRDQIAALRGVVASFLSVSGEGVTFVVKVHPEQHKDAFFSIVDGMKQHMGIQIDPGLHDVVRLRFVSDDPGAKIKDNFTEIPFSEPSAEYLQSKKTYGHEATTLEPIGDADSEYNYNEAVKKAEKLYSFSDGQKWSFLVSVAGSCNVMGMSLQFCQNATLKRFRDKTNISNDRLLEPIAQIYRLYKSQHGTFNTLIAGEKLNKRLREHLIFDWLHQGKKPSDQDYSQIAEQFQANIERVKYVAELVFAEYSQEFGFVEFPKIQKVQIWLSKRWVFRYNVVTGQPEQTDHTNGKPVTINEHELYRQLCLAGFKIPLNDIKSLVKSEFVKPYDPILEYFQSLTWDGKDHIAKLASYVTTQEEAYWPAMFRKALIRSVACGLGLKENRIVMVLYQRKEETGKSSYIRFLNPFGGSNYFTESPIIGGNIKDTEIRFTENFIYNIEELAGLNRADTNKLKADISKAFVKERRPHHTFEVSAPRRCNFWASSNQKEFLMDEGNTRWLVFSIININWAYRNEVDINQVWAQAYHSWKSGETGELDKVEKEIREELNGEYRFLRPEEELLMRYFKPSTESAGEFFSSTEIAIKLNSLSPSLKINANNIGKTIKSIWDMDSQTTRIGGKVARGYWLHYERLLAEGETAKTFTPATDIKF